MNAPGQKGDTVISVPVFYRTESRIVASARPKSAGAARQGPRPHTGTNGRQTLVVSKSFKAIKLDVPDGGGELSDSSSDDEEG